MRKLRWCPICQGEALANFGEMYWRRAHQPPGVLICVDHQEPLCETAVPYGRTAIAASRNTCGDGDTRPEWIHDKRALRILTRIAKLSATLLTEPRHANGNRLEYRLILENAGFCKYKGGIDHRRLIDECSRALEPVRRLIPFAQNSEWIFKVLRGKGPSIHPLLHLMARTFLSLHLAASAASSPAIRISTHVGKTNGVARHERVGLSSLDAEDTPSARRSMVINLLRSGRSVLETANLAGYSRAHVEAIRAMYNELGLVSLKDSAARLRVLTPAFLDELYDDVRGPPDSGGAWTSTKVAELARKKLGHTVAKDTAVRALRVAGMRWQDGRWEPDTASPRPCRRAKIDKNDVQLMLREHQDGVSARALCRKYKISSATFYHLRSMCR
jgi:transposase